MGDDSNIHRDVYILNHQCKEFVKYEWIGQLMGACLRGKENLVSQRDNVQYLLTKTLISVKFVWYISQIIPSY